MPRWQAHYGAKLTGPWSRLDLTTDPGKYAQTAITVRWPLVRQSARSEPTTPHSAKVRDHRGHEVNRKEESGAVLLLFSPGQLQSARRSRSAPQCCLALRAGVLGRGAAPGAVVLLPRRHRQHLHIGPSPRPDCGAYCLIYKGFSWAAAATSWGWALGSIVREGARLHPHAEQCGHGMKPVWPPVCDPALLGI